jgi:uncharacterized protein YabN with tetrapyrrole methylase and pyrophosphatase domain
LEQNHSLVKDNDQELQNENWIGELFFMLNLLAVHLGVDTEKALRNTNRKFEYEVKEFEKGLKLRDQKKDELKKNLTGSLKGLFK